MTPLVRIGTRGSQLALWQANHVAELLRRVTGAATELVVVRTAGDADRSRALHQMPGSGFFTRELQLALQRGEVDLVVHSLKDLPLDEPPGLAVVAVLAREEPREVLLAPQGARGQGGLGLKPGAVVGTSSLRRAAQALACQPDIVIKPLRGNVPTRLRRLDEGAVDALLLAYAGVVRLGCDLNGRLARLFDPDEFVPAPGQGALAVEARLDGGVAARLAARLDDPEAAAATACERHLLRRLGGGCHLPLGAHAVRQADGFRLVAALGEVDAEVTRASVRRVTVVGSDPASTAEAAWRALGGTGPS